MVDRERIAIDLHDLVVRRLFAAGLALQCTMGLVKDPLVVRRLGGVVDDLDSAIRDIRTTMFALGHRRASTVRSLRARVVDLVADTADSLGHDPTLRFGGPVGTAVPEVVAEHLLAVLREALSNVARHAYATATTIDLTVTSNILLRVADNGVGRAGPPPDTRGLRDMRQRAEAISGGVDLTTREGSGFCVQWWAPVGS